MVAPYLALLGYGMQTFGADQQARAQDVANYGASINNRINLAGREQDQALTNSVLAGLGGQWTGSQEQAVGDMSAANQRREFDLGAGTLGAGIAGAQGAPTAIDPALQGAADNIAFTRAKAAQDRSNQTRTDALNRVLTQNAGIDAKNIAVGTAFSNKADRDMMIRNRIADVMKLQNYANGVREAALAKTSSQHALDQASAASTGSGAMYLGALLQAGAVLSNRPQTPGQPGTVGSSIPGQPNPNAVPVGQDPYAPWLDPNDPSGLNPYGN